MVYDAVKESVECEVKGLLLDNCILVNDVCLGNDDILRIKLPKSDKKFAKKAKRLGQIVVEGFQVKVTISS